MVLVCVQDGSGGVIDEPVCAPDACSGKGDVGFFCNTKRDGVVEALGGSDVLFVWGWKAGRVSFVALEEVIGQVEYSFRDSAEPGGRWA